MFAVVRDYPPKLRAFNGAVGLLSAPVFTLCRSCLGVSIQLWLCIALRFNVFSKLLLDVLNLYWCYFSAKQLLVYPFLGSIDTIRLAIICDFLNPTFEVITSDLAAIDARGLPRQTHNLTKLMQRGFRLRRKRREYVAQVYCVVGVPIEIGAGR